MQNEDEQEVSRWIAAARTGDGEAFDRLRKHYEPRVQSFVGKLLERLELQGRDVAALSQEAMFQTLRSIPTLPGRAGTDELERLILLAATAYVHDEADGDGHSGKTRESDAPENSWLREFVARLPDPYREPVRLCALEGMTFVAAGEALGLPPETVRERYEQARNLLQSKLSSRNDV